MIKTAYQLGVQLAMEEAGIKTADAGEGFRLGALGGTGVSLAGLLTHLLSKGKYGISPHYGIGAVYGPALLGGGIGAGIGALTGD